jgi:prepilin-type N-terminal cleavage/methylation domain-containing protein
MEKRRFMKENKGYSLVEMIIVIAIIAIMAGGSMVTVTLINSAKAKEAGVTLDSEVAALVAQSKSQVPNLGTAYDVNGDGAKDDLDEKASKKLNFAIAVYKNTDGKYYIAHGYYNSTDGTFNVYDASNNNDGKGTCISSRVSISYEPASKLSGKIQISSTNETNLKLDGIEIKSSEDGKKYAYVIAFDKSGKCICGVGTYELKKSANNVTIDEISIKANGSHQTD